MISVKKGFLGLAMTVSLSGCVNEKAVQNVVDECKGRLYGQFTTGFIDTLTVGCIESDEEMVARLASADQSG